MLHFLKLAHTNILKISIWKTRELNLKKNKIELATQYDEQVSELEISLEKKNEQLVVLKEKLKKCEKEIDQSNIYMFGPNTNASKRMCPVVGCYGNGSTAGGLTHYT